MSTYYFICCERTKFKCDVASITSGIGALGYSEECLQPFLIAHQGLPLLVFTEHNAIADDESYTEWITWDNDPANRLVDGYGYPIPKEPTINDITTLAMEKIKGACRINVYPGHEEFQQVLQAYNVWGRLLLTISAHTYRGLLNELYIGDGI